MKPEDTKQQFIMLRAEGLSYGKIAKKLNISKATCSAWEANFTNKIAKRKQDRLEELYSAYGMLKDKRISSLGQTLNKINDAINDIDLSDVDPIKLLELKLKYQEALNKEYVAPNTREAVDFSNGFNSSDINQELGRLIELAKAGELSGDQLTQELRILTETLKAYNQTELEQQLEALTASLS